MSQVQIAEMGEFDLDDWDDGGITGLGLDWPEYDGMYGLDDYGCSSCMGDLGAPPAKGGFPWGTVLIGVGGVGVGILAAVLVKKYLLK